MSVRGRWTMASSLGLALAVSAGPANAVFINGSISFSDGFDAVPPTGTTSIVSQLDLLDVQNVAQVFSSSGAFAGSNGLSNGAASDFNVNGPFPQSFMSTTTGWTFTILNISNVTREPFDCSAQGLCEDNLDIDIVGTVSGNGFDPTEFLGTWGATGSCVGSEAAGCTQTPTNSWSASFSATGRAPPPPSVPEPASLGLVSLTLLALAAVRRRRPS